MRTHNTLIGQPMERVEDLRLLRGKGTYVGDIVREGMLHAIIVRSSVAHGALRSIDAAGALAMPGVHGVITAADFGTPPPCVPLRLQPLPQLEPFHQPMLAGDKVRYVGEPIAVVLADSPAIAEDAHDLVVVDIEPLPPVTDRASAEKRPGAAVRGAWVECRADVVRYKGRRREGLCRRTLHAQGAFFRPAPCSDVHGNRAASSRNGMRLPSA